VRAEDVAALAQSADSRRELARAWELFERRPCKELAAERCVVLCDEETGKVRPICVGEAVVTLLERAAARADAGELRRARPHSYASAVDGVTRFVHEAEAHAAAGLVVVAGDIRKAYNAAPVGLLAGALAEAGAVASAAMIKAYSQVRNVQCEGVALQLLDGVGIGQGRTLAPVAFEVLGERWARAADAAGAHWTANYIDNIAVAAAPADVQRVWDALAAEVAACGFVLHDVRVLGGERAAGLHHAGVPIEELDRETGLLGVALEGGGAPPRGRYGGDTGAGHEVRQLADEGGGG
jgi:hypothetical protein